MPAEFPLQVYGRYTFALLKNDDIATQSPQIIDEKCQA